MKTDEYPPDDPEFQDTIIRSFEAHEGGGWTITKADGWSFYVPPESPVAPAVGMPARFYGRGIGAVVRGLFLDGRRVFYRTEAEQDEHHRREQEERDRRRRYDYEKHRVDHDRRIAALPGPFRDRLVSFRRTSSDWGWQHEGYELATCETAVLLAGLGSVEAIREFRELPWDEQKARLSGLDDGLSGNQFGAAVNFAGLYLTNPADVPRQHAAICPLVGCKDAGCYAGRPSITDARPAAGEGSD